MREASGCEFDCDQAAYDHALDQGIAVSGEDRSYFAQGRIAFLAACLERLGEQPLSVLDFGCGPGGGSRVLRERLHARDVLGVDVSERGVELARERYGGEGVRFMSRDEFRPAAGIDLAFCNGVFHHIPMAERPEAVRYVFAALRPGGLFALWDNNPWNPGARYVMSRIPFDRDAVMIYPGESRRLLRATGFEILRTDYLFVFPRPLRLLRILEPSLSSLPLGAQYQVLARRPPA